MYLLSTYAQDGRVPGAPTTPEEMDQLMQRIMVLEAEMEATHTFVFGGALASSEEAVVLDRGDTTSTMTEGPFADSKVQLAGFYIIDVDDHARALYWAHRVAEATGHPIELRAFRATGKVADSVGDEQSDLT